MADLSKETYKKALAVVLGIETIAGKGPTGRAGRAALRAGAKAVLAGGRIAVPAAATTARVAAPAALTLARQNPYAAAGLGALALQQAGAFDPVETYIQEKIDERVQPIIDLPKNPLLKPTIKRKVSKYQKAVKAGMSAVKRSKFLGSKGKISNAKTAFARVNKVASAVNKGKKVASKGVTGVIKRAVGRFL